MRKEQGKKIFEAWFKDKFSDVEGGWRDEQWSNMFLLHKEEIIRVIKFTETCVRKEINRDWNKKVNKLKNDLNTEINAISKIKKPRTVLKAKAVHADYVLFLINKIFNVEKRGKK